MFFGGVGWGCSGRVVRAVLTTLVYVSGVKKGGWWGRGKKTELSTPHTTEQKTITSPSFTTFR